MENNTINKLNKIKLMMSYQLGKTLEENIKSTPILSESVFGDIDEAGGEFGLANDLKAAGSESEKLAHMAQFFKMTEESVGIAAAKNLTDLQNEFKAAVKADAKDGFRGLGSQLGPKAKQAAKAIAVKEILASGKELTEQDIVNIIDRVKAETKLNSKSIEGSYVTRSDASKAAAEKRKNGLGGTGGVADGVQDLKTAEQKAGITFNQNINQFNTGSEAARATKEEISAGGLDSTTKAVAEESAEVTERMPQSRWEKWKAWGKRNPNKRNLLYLLGLGAGAWAAYKYFSKDSKTGKETKPDEVRRNTLSDCLGPVFDANNGRILQTSTNDPVAAIKNYPGYEQYSSLGGLWFFITSGRVMTADQGNTKRGNYSCSGNDVVITWDGEGETPATSDTTNTTGATTGDTTTTTGTTTNTTGTTTGDTTAQTARIADMIKTKDNEGKPQETTPEVQSLIDKGKEIYTKLYDNYNADGQPKPFIKKAGNRLKYKGELLPQADLDALNQYIKSLGYSFLKQKDKRYVPGEKDEKYVWIEEPQPVGQQPAAQPQQPQEPAQLSEDFIKNIVGKHLRSKL